MDIHDWCAARIDLLATIGELDGYEEFDRYYSISKIARHMNLENFQRAKEGKFPNYGHVDYHDIVVLAKPFVDLGILIHRDKGRPSGPLPRYSYKTNPSDIESFMYAWAVLEGAPEEDRTDLEDNPERRREITQTLLESAG